jgi:hypothetical protein
MNDDDRRKIWEEYFNETVANPETIDRVRRSLNNPDIEDEERHMIVSMLRELEQQAQTDDLQTVKQKMFATLKKLLNNEETNITDNQDPPQQEQGT